MIQYIGNKMQSDNKPSFSDPLSRFRRSRDRCSKFKRRIKMANIKSAKKRILVNQAKALQNQMVKSQLKTVIKKFNAAVESGDKAQASELYKLAVKKVDLAVAHGILHKNNAAHKKSEFTKKFNAMA